jgi:hypothetical protein
MFNISGLPISGKSPPEINRKVPTICHILTVHLGKIEHALLLGTGLALIPYTFSIPVGSINSEAGILWQPEKKREDLNMKKLYPYFCLVFVLALVVPAYAGNPETGNGAPSGPHYNLNVIGVPKDKSAAMDDNNGHRIFVKLDGKSKIMLGEGEEFRVLDANGTDGNGARFQLPCPDPDNDGVTVYTVWARALGKPGGSAGIGTCAYDLPEEEGEDPVLVCSTHVLTMERTGKRSKFENVSKELLYIYADVDGDGLPERLPLFDDALQDYFWNYDNHGLKLAQFRFYEMSTDVTE